MQATKEQMEKMSSNLMLAYTEMNTMLRDTMNATLQSVTIMTKGCNELCDHVSTLMQKSIEQSTKINQTLLSATSVNDLVDTQNTYMKSNLDNMMSEMKNLSQMSTRIAQQAAEPVTKHVNETISKISKVKAA